MNKLNDLISAADSLKQVSPQTERAFRDKLDHLSVRTYDNLVANRDLGRLIGFNPLQRLRDNLYYHGHFMSSVLSLGSYQLLAQTLPWLYRTYHARRYAYEYFTLEAKAWQEALTFLDEADAASILPAYHWILNNHETIIDVSKLSGLGAYQGGIDSKPQMKFLAALLAGQHTTCLDIAVPRTSTAEEIEVFYEEYIRPTLYEVGRLWEQNKITVAQEHLATAIAGRIISSISPPHPPSGTSRGKAVVTTAQNERHELGSVMVADTLENDGWEVKNLGVDLPVEDLLLSLKTLQPQILALSISTSCHLAEVKNTIAILRKENELNNLRVMVGGYALVQHPYLWKAIGADGFAEDLAGAKSLARQWSSA